MLMLRLNRMPIATRVFVAPCLTLGALLLLVVIALAGLQDGKRHVRDLSERAFETFSLSVSAKDAASAVQQRLLDAILVSATETDKARFAPRIEAFELAAVRATFAFNALASRMGDTVAAVIQVRGDLDAYLASAREVLHIAPTDPASAWIIVNEVRRDYATLDAGLERFRADANALRESAAQQAILAATLASTAFLVTVALAVAFSTLATVVVGRSITRPIARLTAAMSELAGGHLSVTVPELDRIDEVGSMAVAMQRFKSGMIEADRLAAERETARASELDRLRQLADATFEGIVIHRQGIIVGANAAFCSLLGRPDRAALRGRHLLDFIAPHAIELARERLSEPACAAVELDMLHADGSGLPVEILSRQIDYDGGRATLVAVRDLSERKRAEAQIRQLAFHDKLTGLPNRALFGDRLTQALAMTRRDGTQVALLYLDLDHFKEVNDTLGHTAGDLLPSVVAERLRGCLRESDTLARLGGDEFAVIQPGAHQPQAAETLARRLVEVLEPVVELNGNAARIGVSIGIALSEPAGAAQQTTTGGPQAMTAAQQLMMGADVALYQAKDTGRGGYSFYSSDMNARIVERRAMEEDLRTALAEGHLFVEYQPQVDLRTRRVVGAEAVLRWNRPGRGMVPPDRIIPMAEDCGLIGAIGRFVLREACRKAAGWPGPMRVAVNISREQFLRPDFVEDVAAALLGSGLEPSRLELEITERVLLRGTTEVLAVLSCLRGLGVRLAMDDFGTGFSSVCYLMQFRFDKIKIDESLVWSLGDDDNAWAIVRAVVGLSDSLHICSNAEGVETQHQAALLLEQGCNEAQGHLYGRPMPAEDFLRYIGAGAATPQPLLAPAATTEA
jgi:diguanylate cyclase (GGDEF)-like protein/PAS domain S-box-containing protein